MSLVKATNSNAKRILYSYVTSLLFFIVSLGYCYFILRISQYHYVFEILIAIVFPLVGSRFFKKADNWPDMKRLILLETGFNILCIISKVTDDLQVDWGVLLSWMFAIFFFFQTFGFLISQVKKKKYKCLPSSILMGIALVFWFFDSLGEKTIVTGNGEVQFWGGNAPMYLQVMYVFWVSNVFLIEFRQYLPKATMYLAHAATVVIALMSNEFFHARILTASNLFVLNLIIVYKSMDWNGRYFSVIPSLAVFKDDSHWVTRVFPMIMNIGCVLALLYGLFIV
ncbi:hypothetical protein [Aquimarina pacifica]|uniref:hypothetical protein n=1 Tax=Aquimarina pacifica TaxID=1296415 RepID=UPI00046E7B26|nr:hypothetical protein [Aquimarina pacifica]